MLLNCDVGEDSWESLGLQGDPTSPSWRRLVLGVHWKDWCWSWNSNTLANWCEKLTHWKRPWCWERLRAGGKGMRWLDSITDSMDKNLSKFWEIVKIRGAWNASVHGVVKNWTWLKRLSMHARIGEGNGNLLQCSCLENPKGRGAWWAATYWVAQSRTGLKHSRLLWSSRSPRICSNSCPLSQWCYLTISSSATPFSFCLQSFPASGSFPALHIR